MVGCGNLLRGDDAVGPTLIRRLWELGLPPGVRCADAGTGGMDVAFQMRGVAEVILIDACRSGARPGDTFALAGGEVEHLPPLGANLHAFRWDHALAFARWLLKEEYPRCVRVYLIEAGQLEPGAPLSPPVRDAMEALAARLHAELALHRPQPVGLHPLPAGLLLLPPPDPVDQLRAERALRGGDELPAAWNVLGFAIRGEIGAAMEALGKDESLLATYNRFVLAPSAAAFAALRARATGPVAAMTEIAAYCLGLVEDTPTIAGLAPLDGELRAYARIVEAASHLERARREAALEALDLATADARDISPLLAAQAMAQAASLRHGIPGHPLESTAAAYRAALALLGDDAPRAQRAELWVQLGMVVHEIADGRRDALLEAVRCYQAALRCDLSSEFLPELYALAHNNLALAYLALPGGDASDGLRRGMAVQSLRSALSACDRQTDPEEWARTQMHLANALVYLPSAHPADNLVQAVDLYEELIGVRDRSIDPVGHARLLANQATALAHLGVFGAAVEKLSEARKLFHWYDEPGLAAVALEQLDHITARRAESAAAGSLAGSDP